MTVKLIATTLIIALTISISPIYAKEQESNLQELYTLCSKFPSNTRCKGQNIPIPINERRGFDARCSLALGKEKTRRECKIAVNEKDLSVYIEEGKPIRLLNNKRATYELKIPLNHIFSQTYRKWNVKKLDFSDFIPSDYSVINIGFIDTTSVNQINYSNFLEVALIDMKFASYLKERLEKLDTVSAIALLKDKLTTKANMSEQVKQLLSTKQCINCDLRKADLRQVNLNGANLEGANLQGANLANSQLERAYLVGANFSEANLEKANLSYAWLAAASLEKANLENAKFHSATLQSANLKDAILNNAQFEITSQRVTDLKYANLSNASLILAKLKGVDLTGANLSKANLSRANLNSETSSDSIWDLTTATREFNSRTYMNNANLSGANLSNAKLDDLYLENANLSGASISSAIRTSNLCNAIMPDGTTSKKGCKK